MYISHLTGIEMQKICETRLKPQNNCSKDCATNRNIIVQEDGVKLLHRCLRIVAACRCATFLVAARGTRCGKFMGQWLSERFRHARLPQTLGLDPGKSSGPKEMKSRNWGGLPDSISNRAMIMVSAWASRLTQASISQRVNV